MVKQTLLPGVTKDSLCSSDSKNRNAKCSFEEWGLRRREWVAMRRRERRVSTWKLMCGCYCEHCSNCYCFKSVLKYATVAWNLQGSRSQVIWKGDNIRLAKTTQHHKLTSVLHSSMCTDINIYSFHHWWSECFNTCNDLQHFAFIA